LLRGRIDKLATAYRLERLRLRSWVGVAKVFGTLVYMGGAMLMTLYTRIAIKLWSSPFHLRVSKVGRNASHEDLTKASLLVVASCVSWSDWFTIQVNLCICLYVHFLFVYSIITFTRDEIGSMANMYSNSGFSFVGYMIKLVKNTHHSILARP